MYKSPLTIKTRTLAQELESIESEMNAIHRQIAVARLLPQTAFTRSTLDSLQLKLDINRILASSARSKLAELTGSDHWSHW